MILSVCEFRENRQREGRYFLMDVKKKLIYSCTVKPYDI
jgi:hypothetical protein